MVEYVVDDRVFLLGLDHLYREAMKVHERGELLACARRVADVLSVSPARVPVEGYYAEDADLSVYFLLMRALQDVPLSRAAEVEPLDEFQRLLAVTSSSIFGVPRRTRLLPTGVDALTAALTASTDVADWTVPRLTKTAARLAREMDDCSLVALAARAEDAVVLAALRESVVLYTMMAPTASPRQAWPKFVWRVTPDLSAAAQRFVSAFNSMFGIELPPAEARYAHAFAAGRNKSSFIGRCARLGQSQQLPTLFYHWAVAAGPDGSLCVDEFWAPEIWTTDRYRKSRRERISHPDPTRIH